MSPTIPTRKPVQHAPTQESDLPYTRTSAFHHALLFLLCALAFLILASTTVRTQNKSVEDFPNIHNQPLRLRLVDGPHGRVIIGARLTLTGGYDNRDLKLGLWRAEVKTDEHGEARLPRMIANLPLLTINGAHLSTCEGQPRLGYYSVEEIRSQGLSTVNGCGSSSNESEPGLLTLVVERKSGDAKLEKKQELETRNADAKHNHEKIYRTNGTLAPAESASATANSITPSTLNFTAPQIPLEQPASVTHSNPAPTNSQKPALFALNSKPTLITTVGESSPIHQTTPDLDSIYLPTPTPAPNPVQTVLSVVGMAAGSVAGGYKSAALHKTTPVHHAAKKAPVKPASDKQSPPPDKKASSTTPIPPAGNEKSPAKDQKPAPLTDSAPAAKQTPPPTKTASAPSQPAPATAKPTTPAAKPANPTPATKPKAGK